MRAAFGCFQVPIVELVIRHLHPAGSQLACIALSVRLDFLETFQGLPRNPKQ